MPMGGTLSIWLLQHLITKVLSKIMKKFYIRWISEIVLLTTAIMFILMFDIQYTAGFIMQSIFMIVMVIVGVFIFKHEEDILDLF